jgi:ATP-dependent Lhr-like helicase
VDEVFGRPLAPRWLGTGVPMSSDLARRIFLFRMQAAEVLRDGPESLRAWLGSEFRLQESAVDAIVNWIQLQESMSETPTLRSMLIECVSMQAGQEYFLHTPLSRSANEVIAGVLLRRWRRAKTGMAMALAADLGLYVLMSSQSLSADAWRESLSSAAFGDDFHGHLDESDLLATQFGQIAQTGLMVLRNPQGRKRKVGGKDWPERRLFDQLRMQSPDFVLLRQARREAISRACDLAEAQKFIEQLALRPICIRNLPRPSPFGEMLLGGAQANITNSQSSELVEKR